MDWKLCYPCCIEILVCVGCWSQTVKIYLQRKRWWGCVCLCMCMCVKWVGVGCWVALSHARIQSIRTNVIVPIRKYMEKRERGQCVSSCRNALKSFSISELPPQQNCFVFKDSVVMKRRWLTKKLFPEIMKHYMKLKKRRAYMLVLGSNYCFWYFNWQCLCSTVSIPCIHRASLIKC